MFGKNILVATDFSFCSDQAVAYALELAMNIEGKVHFVHSYELNDLPESALRVESMLSESEEHAAHQLEAVADKWRATGRIGATRVMLGDPVSTIVRTAKELSCDLIVVGTHGRRGIERMLLGSVAEGVVRSAPCPVLVVRDATRK